MQKLRKQLKVYCINNNINMNRVAKHIDENPFPMGTSNIYRFYIGKTISDRQLDKLDFFFELKNGKNEQIENDKKTI